MILPTEPRQMTREGCSITKSFPARAEEELVELTSLKPIIHVPFLALNHSKVQHQEASLRSNFIQLLNQKTTRPQSAMD